VGEAFSLDRLGWKAAPPEKTSTGMEVLEGGGTIQRRRALMTRGCRFCAMRGTTMFYKASGDGYRQALEGIQLKALVQGERTLLVEFRLQQGSALPRHSHPYEQTGYLLSGRIRLFVGDRVCEAGPGDSWSIPMNIEHRAEILADAVAIEVFAPVREDYLPAAGS
jgi:quercetin dioxygenase-like cupin family protein